MSKIRIKNFGPIKDGFKETLPDGTVNEWLDVKKVTVFIGNQGSGKSTVAKLISTFMWLEKALNRNDFTEYKFLNREWFRELLEYHSIEAYLQETTLIHYLGDKYEIKYGNSFTNKFECVEQEEEKKYVVPKIMYVPSERNLLSVIKNAYKIKNLPGSLFDFAEELRRCQEIIASNDLRLPINNVAYNFDSSHDISYIFDENFKIALHDASSGFQSFVPLFVVTKVLSEWIETDSEKLRADIVSVNQQIRVNTEIHHILNHSSQLINEKDKIRLINEVRSRFISKCYVNIVEELEQNLFPSSQRKTLNSLLEYNNLNMWNKLVMTTHSPYVINFLTLAVEANRLKLSINDSGLSMKLNEIVPLKSTLNGEDLSIYELDELHGTIKKLKTYKGLPSDENYLNQGLAESNDLFSELLDIEDLCK